MRVFFKVIEFNDLDLLSLFGMFEWDFLMLFKVGVDEYEVLDDLWFFLCIEVLLYLFLVLVSNCMVRLMLFWLVFIVFGGWL